MNKKESRFIFHPSAFILAKAPPLNSVSTEGKVKLVTGLQIICLVSLIVFAHSFDGLPSSNAQQKLSTSSITIINRTRSLELVSVERAKDSLLLTFRNNYPQAVSGVVVSVQKGSTNMVSFPNSKEMIAPGATREEAFLLFPDRVTREVVILAAFLVDCTIDGEPETVKKEEAERRGEKKLNERLLAVVNKVLDSPEFEDMKSLNKLERELASLAEKTSRASSEEGYVRRVSLSTFALSKIWDLQKVLKEGAKPNIKEELINFRSLLEAKRTSC